MGVVAIVALLVWGATLWQRSARFAREAHSHADMLIGHEINLDRIDFDGHSVDSERRTMLTEYEVRERAFMIQLIEYELMLVNKYRFAARFPWVTPEPDPPPPVPPSTMRRKVPNAGDRVFSSSANQKNTFQSNH